MSVIGSLRQSDLKNLNEFVGRIDTLDLALSVRVVRTSDRPSDRAPSHVVLARGKSGSEVQIGSAWMKVTPGDAGEEVTFLSVTLDDPSFDRPLNIAAFQSSEVGRWDVSWRRRRPERPGDTAEA